MKEEGKGPQNSVADKTRDEPILWSRHVHKTLDRRNGETAPRESEIKGHFKQGRHEELKDEAGLAVYRLQE